MKRKKTLTILVLSFLLVIVLCVAGSYSKYASFSNGAVDLDLAKWNIKVNDCDIVNGDEKDECNGTVTVGENEITYSFMISPTYSVNTNVLDNKIAPGEYSLFGITIEPLDTEVSMNYTLNFGTPTMNGNEVSNDEIAFSICNSDIASCGQSGSQFTNVSFDNPYESQVIPYHDELVPTSRAIDYKENFVFKVDWKLYAECSVYKGSNQLEYDKCVKRVDEADTYLGINANTIQIPVTLTFKQYVG